MNETNERQPAVMLPDAFSIRTGEVVGMCAEYPATAKRVIAARLVKMSLPDTGAPPKRSPNGVVFEQDEIVFAQLDPDGCWEFVRATPATRHYLAGSLLKAVDFGLCRGDRWVYFWFKERE